MKLIPDKKYSNMYRVQWPNGDISISTPNPDKVGGHYGFYNIDRAAEFLSRKEILNYRRNITHYPTPQ